MQTLKEPPCFPAFYTLIFHFLIFLLLNNPDPVGHQFENTRTKSRRKNLDDQNEKQLS